MSSRGMKMPPETAVAWVVFPSLFPFYSESVNWRNQIVPTIVLISRMRPRNNETFVIVDCLNAVVTGNRMQSARSVYWTTKKMLNIFGASYQYSQSRYVIHTCQTRPTRSNRSKVRKQRVLVHEFWRTAFSLRKILAFSNGPTCYILVFYSK